MPDMTDNLTLVETGVDNAPDLDDMVRLIRFFRATRPEPTFPDVPAVGGVRCHVTDTGDGAMTAEWVTDDGTLRRVVEGAPLPTAFFADVEGYLYDANGEPV